MSSSKRGAGETEAQRYGVWARLFGEVQSSTFCYALMMKTAALVAPRDARHHGLLVLYAALNFRGTSGAFAPREEAYLNLYAFGTTFVENTDDESCQQRDGSAWLTKRSSMSSTLTLMDNPVFLQEVKVNDIVPFLDNSLLATPLYSSNRAMAYSTSISIIDARRASQG